MVDIYSVLLSPYVQKHLRESSRSVALVRLDNLATGKLLVGVSGPDDLASVVVDNGEGSEAVALAELAAPAGGDGVSAAVGGTAVGVGGSVSLHDVGALSGSTGAGVDAEVPGAGGVFGVADTLGVLDSPLGTGGHHGLAIGGGSGEGRGGEEAGSEEELGELHGEERRLVGWLVVLEDVDENEDDEPGDMEIFI